MKTAQTGLLAAMVLAVGACGGQADQVTPAASQATSAAASPAAPAAPTSAATLKGLSGSDIRQEKIGTDFTLPSTLGKPVSLSDSKGKVVVLVPGYTHCPDVCPTSMLAYKEAMKLLGSRAKEVQLYFVSVDPARDKADYLKRYLAMFDPSFVGLIPDTPEAMQHLQENWRISAEKAPTPNGDYYVNHSSGQYILDKNGKAVVYEPFGQTARQLADDLILVLDMT